MPRSSGTKTQTRTPGQRRAKGGALAASIVDAEKQARAMTSAEVAELPRAPLDAFAPHPLNPPHRHEDEVELAELAANIKVRGVLSPPIVVAREEILERDPEIGKRISPDVRFVFLDGHRRWAASKLAEVDDIPYLVRNDLADPGAAAEVFLAAGIHSLSLTPIEEARGYERLAKAYGRNQSQLATAVGVSQSRISKTLQLLKLPGEVQAAIEADEISAHAARELMNLPAGRRVGAFRRARGAGSRPDPLRFAEHVRAEVKRDLRTLEAEQARAKARETLRHEGIDEIESPAELFGDDSWYRHSLSADEVAEVRAQGGLAGASIDQNGLIRYFSIDEAPRHRRPDDDASSEEYSNGISRPGADSGKSQEDARAELHAAKVAADEAHEGRLCAIELLLSDGPEPLVMLDILADALLGQGYLGVTADIDGRDDESVAPVDIGRGAAHLRLVAAALRSLEAEAAQHRYPLQPWPAHVRSHVRRLADRGFYDLTTYDTTRLDDDGTPQ